jgi:WD40 repeat protein
MKPPNPHLDGDSRRLVFASWAAVGGVFLFLAVAVWFFMPIRPRATLPKGSEVLAISPDGPLIAARLGDKVNLWEVATGQLAAVLPSDVGGSPESVYRFSSDSRWLAASCGNSLKLWAVPSGQERASAEVSGDMTDRQSFIFSPDSTWLAYQVDAPNYEEKLVVWDLAQERARATLSGPNILNRLFSPDGKTLVIESAGNNRAADFPYGRIRIWDSSTGQEIRFFETPRRVARVFAFSPDSRILAGGDLRGALERWPWEVKLWDLTTSAELGKFPVSGEVRELRFAADGHCLLVSCSFHGYRQSFHLIDLTVPLPGENALAPPLTSQFMPEVVETTLSPDGLQLALGSNADDAPVVIENLPDRKRRAELKPLMRGERLSPGQFTNDGKLLAVVGVPPNPPPTSPIVRWLFGSPRALPSQLEESELHLYETDTGRCQGTLPMESSRSYWLTADSKILVLVDREHILALWDLPLHKSWGLLFVWWTGLAVCLLAIRIYLRRWDGRKAAPSLTSEMVSK